jgi:hypothetical protein
MRIISDTTKERLITFEMTEKEMYSMLAAVGKSPYTYIEEYFKMKNIVGLDCTEHYNLYTKLAELILNE